MQDEELMAMQKKIECIFTAEQMMNEGVDLDYITEVYLQPDKHDIKRDVASESDGEIDIAQMLVTSCNDIRPAKELFEVMDEPG